MVAWSRCSIVVVAGVVVVEAEGGKGKRRREGDEKEGFWGQSISHLDRTLSPQLLLSFHLRGPGTAVAVIIW